MLLDEKSLSAHKYLYFASFILLLMFLIYIYTCDKQTYVDTDSMWTRTFKNIGLSDSDIEKISHDADVWYYDNKNTCVAYDDWRGECPKELSVCANDSVGNATEQAKLVQEAIINPKNKGRHPNCPLVYDT